MKISFHRSFEYFKISWRLLLRYSFEAGFLLLTQTAICSAQATAPLAYPSDTLLQKTFLYSYRQKPGDRHALSLPAILAPSVGIGYGVIALHTSVPEKLNFSTRNEIREDHPHFLTHVDNYLQFSPAVAVLGLNLADVHGKNDFTDELGVYGVSTAIMLGTVWSLKAITHEERPDGSSFNSFPSGHTATAFAAAEWLRAEYWNRSPWIGVGGYAVATATGILRVYNNRHWVSDVVAGAAIGFLSTRVAYAVNPWIERHVFPKRARPKAWYSLSSVP